MNKLLFTITSFLVLSTFISCSPDEDEAEQQSINAQNQLKTITVEAVSELSISPPTTMSSQVRYDGFFIYLPVALSLSNTVPNNIGQNTLITTFTAAPSSNLNFMVQRTNYLQDFASTPSIITEYCGDVTINLYSNNVLFHTVTKEMGGGTCPDGVTFTYNVIVPM